MLTSHNARTTNSKGFTIVEFMIATLVFSVVLMATTAAILQIGKAYRRSMNVSNTQAAARNLVDSIAQAVQYSSGSITQPAPVDGTSGICAGNKQFLYVLGRQISDSTGGTQTRNAVMVRQNASNCAMESIVSSAPGGSPSELLGRGMRLAKLSVSGSSGSLHTVTARVVYGDDDLLCSPSITSGAGSCSKDAPPMSTSDILGHDDLQCRPGAGSEYCAFSELSVVVQRRL